MTMYERLSKMNSRKLSIIANKGNPNARKLARNILENRANKALNVMNKVKRARKNRVLSSIRKRVNNKMRELEPLLKRYKRFNRLSSTNHQLTPNQNAFLQSVMNEPWFPNIRNARYVIPVYYSTPIEFRKPMTNRNFALLFANGRPTVNTIERRLYRQRNLNNRNLN